MTRRQGIVCAPVADMESEGEYVQLSSWAELIEWLEREGYKSVDDVRDWNPAPKRKNKKKPPQAEGLF